MRARPAALLALTFGGLLSGCADGGGPPPADPQMVGPGRLVIVGGGLAEDNAEVYRAIEEGREGTGPLCVLPTASGEPAASMEAALTTLATYAGPGAVAGILLSQEDPSRADSSSVAGSIASCSGFFFTGGAQSRVLDVFLPGGDTTEAFRSLKLSGGGSRPGRTAPA